MPTEDLIDRQCTGKVKHLTMKDALASAKIMHKKYKKKFRAYQCQFCDGFHVGGDRSVAAAMRRNIK